MIFIGTCTRVYIPRVSLGKIISKNLVYVPRHDEVSCRHVVRRLPARHCAKAVLDWRQLAARSMTGTVCGREGLVLSVGLGVAIAVKCRACLAEARRPGFALELG